MKIKIHRHNQTNHSTLSPAATSVVECLEQLEHEFVRNSATELRKNILAALMSDGWSDSVKIARNSRITITSIRERTGFCLQTGNMARFYADFLKLQLLHKKGHIDSAIYGVLSKEASLKMGSNLANSDRVVLELAIFQQIVTVPMIVIEIGSE